MLLFVLSFALTGCVLVDFIFPPYPPPGAGDPRVFTAPYDRVWNAAIDALDKRGYVIRQMSKEDGYITTDKNEYRYSRTKVSIRLIRVNGTVRVEIRDYREELNYDANPPYWGRGIPSWRLRKGILDDIESKL